MRINWQITYEQYNYYEFVLVCEKLMKRCSHIMVVTSDKLEKLPTNYCFQQYNLRNQIMYTVFQKKTSTHIIGYKLRNSCPILIIFDIKIPHII